MKSFVYLATFLCLIPPAIANEAVDIRFDTLPKAVQKTVANIVEKHHIYKIKKIIDESHVKYEIMSTKPVNNKDFLDTDITVASNGRMIKLKREVSVFSVPFKITKQITHQYPDIKVDQIKRVELYYFELTGTAQGKKLKFKLFENGEIQEIH